MRAIKYVLLVLVVSVGLPCGAQQKPEQPLTTTPVNPNVKPVPKTRPTIGVALEGGGARGSTHRRVKMV